MNEIKYILPWKDNIWIKISEQIRNELNMWDDFSYDIEIINSINGTILNKITLGKARGYFDIIPVLNKDIIVVGYFNYIDNDSCIMIDIYQLTNDKLYLKIQHKIKSEYSCGGTSGKICNYGGETLYLIWTDIYNSDYFSCFEFNLNLDMDLNKNEKTNKITNKVKKIRFEEEMQFRWDLLYMLSPDHLIYSRALGHSSNQIELALFDVSKSNCFSMSTITLPDYIIHNVSENMGMRTEEFDTMIYDFFCVFSGGKNYIYCLIRIKTYFKPNPLHIQKYFIDVIIQVNGVDSKLHDISTPIYFTNNKDYEGYFGKRPYWIKQLNESGISFPKIFNEQSINRNIIN